MPFTHKHLKQRQRAERDAHHINLGLRIHRALSWLDKAERCEDDLDAQFIFLWIAFNAAYANEFDNDNRYFEKEVFTNFLKRLCEFDKTNKLYELIWKEFPKSIRVLLDNEYIYQPFWDYQNKKISQASWKKQFKMAKKQVNKAVASENTTQVLAVIFNRLYTLRNQLIHGGATWNSRTNRDQLRDSVAILGKLVPIIIELMLDNADSLWGEPCYPVVDAC